MKRIGVSIDFAFDLDRKLSPLGLEWILKQSVRETGLGQAV
jgi:hypothetical protein